MSKFTKRICFAFLGAILVLLFFNNSYSQSFDKDILDKHIEWNMINPNIYQTFAILAAKGIPIGFEDTFEFSNSKNDKTIHLESGTLREILNSVIKQDSDFKWEVRDGVVNIYPARSRDEILKTFLDTKLQSFSSKKEGGRKQIANIIYSSEAIKTFLNSRQVKLGIAIWAELQIDDLTKDIDIPNTDLREILNKIVRDSSIRKQWSVQRTRDGGVYLVF